MYTKEYTDVFDVLYSVFEKPFVHHTKIICKRNGKKKVLYNSKRDFGIPADVGYKPFKSLTITDKYFIYECKEE